MVKQMIYDKILYNRAVKRATMLLLNSNFLVNNKIYQFFHHRHVRKIMDRYKNFPHCVKVENTNACNSNCIMCPHSKMKRKIGFMSWELFKRVVDECSRCGVEHISLHNFGEPLLDKTFPEKVAYAKFKNIPRVTSNTNASFLSEDVAKRLLDSGLDELFISIDAATKETFEKIRRGLDYDTVENNIKRLVELRNKAGKTKPRVVVDFVELDENKHEKKLFLKKWEGIADRVCISSLHNWGGQYHKSSGIHKKYVSASGAPCRLLWTDLVVNWDGSVPICCQDTDNEIVMGDVNEKSIKELWTGQIFEAMRRKHLDGLFRDISMCKNCKLNTFWWVF